MLMSDVLPMTEEEGGRKEKPKRRRWVVPVMILSILAVLIGTFFGIRATAPWFHVSEAGVLSFNWDLWKFFNFFDLDSPIPLPSKYDGMIKSAREDCVGAFRQRQGVRYDGSFREFIRYNPWFFEFQEDWYAKKYAQRIWFTVVCDDCTITYTPYLLHETNPSTEEIGYYQSIYCKNSFDGSYQYWHLYGASLKLYRSNNKNYDETIMFQTLELFYQWLETGVYQYYPREEIHDAEGNWFYYYGRLAQFEKEDPHIWFGFEW